jgi:L-threonylcarbamoyladenylate synthase
MIAQAAEIVAQGGIIGFPTDTVYGIGCAPTAFDAIHRIYAIKKRSLAKPLILLMDALSTLEKYLPPNAVFARDAARNFLPGPLTLIVERPAHIDARVVSGGNSVGLRVPANDFCCQLLSVTGPLATTSANMSGEMSYCGVEGVERPTVDFFIYACYTKYNQASSIIDFQEMPPRILREGALKADRFEIWYQAWLAKQNSGMRDTA